MKKSFLLILILVSGIHGISGQGQQNLKQLFLDAEYFFMYEDYEEALYSYNTLYKRGYADNANINYRIGQCYLNIPGEKHKAIAYLEKASQNVNAKYSEGSFKETTAPYDAFYFLGNAYRIDNQFDKARNAYNQYKNLVGPKNTVANELADKEISACQYAQTQMDKPIFEKAIDLGRPVSTSGKDFFPVVSGDESVLVYNSAQKFYDAIFFSTKKNNKWSSPVNITPEVQSDGNQYVSSISFDGKELYLRIEDNFEANILISAYENGRWSKSRKLGRNINTKFWEGNASVSKDGKTLYFSSNRPGGLGALDIYMSQRESNGDWGPAINLGKTINTEFNEDAPFISEDGKQLWFVSQGHQNMGGYDIFYSVADENGNWSEPVNAGYPLNTTDDNNFFDPADNGKAGFMALYLDNGYGYDDLYKVFLDEKYYASSMQDKTSPISETADLSKKSQLADTVKRVLPENIEKVITQPVTTQQEKENIVLQSLFFDFNSSALTVLTKKELDHLAMIMKNYPGLKIKLIGNTDALGSEEYNQWLSEKRANNSKNYLSGKGIDASRITVKGDGRKNFVAINKNTDGSDNPDGRKLNRRVDIRLDEQAPENIQIKPVPVPEALKIK